MWLRSFLNPRILIAVENNNYFPTEAYQMVTDGDFITQIVEENDLEFLFDIAHAKITAHNRSLDYSDYLKTLPIDRTVQIHISRYEIKNGLARDAHKLPDEKTWQEVKILLDKIPVRYATIEYYKDYDGLVRGLKKLRDLVEYN